MAFGALHSYSDMLFEKVWSTDFQGKLKSKHVNEDFTRLWIHTEEGAFYEFDLNTRDIVKTISIEGRLDVTVNTETGKHIVADPRNYGLTYYLGNTQFTTVGVNIYNDRDCDYVDHIIDSDDGINHNKYFSPTSLMPVAGVLDKNNNGYYVWSGRRCVYEEEHGPYKVPRRRTYIAFLQNGEYTSISSGFDNSKYFSQWHFSDVNGIQADNDGDYYFVNDETYLRDKDTVIPTYSWGKIGYSYLYSSFITGPGFVRAANPFNRDDYIDLDIDLNDKPVAYIEHDNKAIFIGNKVQLFEISDDGKSPDFNIPEYLLVDEAFTPSHTVASNKIVEWSLGGVINTNKKPYHSFSEPGIKQITLYYDNGGKKDSLSKALEILEYTNSGISSSLASSMIGDTVSFTTNRLSESQSISWSVDGNEYSADSIKVSFLVSGPHRIILKKSIGVYSSIDTIIFRVTKKHHRILNRKVSFNVEREWVTGEGSSRKENTSQILQNLKHKGCYYLNNYTYTKQYSGTLYYEFLNTTLYQFKSGSFNIKSYTNYKPGGIDYFSFRYFEVYQIDDSSTLILYKYNGLNKWPVYIDSILLQNIFSENYNKPFYTYNDSLFVYKIDQMNNLNIYFESEEDEEHQIVEVNSISLLDINDSTFSVFRDNNHIGIVYADSEDRIYAYAMADPYTISEPTIILPDSEKGKLIKFDNYIGGLLLHYEKNGRFYEYRHRMGIENGQVMFSKPWVYEITNAKVWIDGYYWDVDQVTNKINPDLTMTEIRVLDSNGTHLRSYLPHELFIEAEYITSDIDGEFYINSPDAFTQLSSVYPLPEAIEMREDSRPWNLDYLTIENPNSNATRFSPYSRDGRIVVPTLHPDASFEIYDLAGRQVSAERQLSPGCYLVRVEGITYKVLVE